MKLKKYGPVLEPQGDIGAIFNCGAIEYKGEILLLARVIKKGYKKREGGGFDNYISEIWMARSKDGKNFKLDDKPFIKPGQSFDKYGCEDPRITKLGDDFFITYTALSTPAFEDGGNRVGLASTTDFNKITKYGIIGPDVGNKDAAIFPRKINGKIAVLHRVMPNIQIMYFDSISQLKQNRDEQYWINYCESLDDYVVIRRGACYWDEDRIGGGPPPIKTDHGWLLIYHSIDKHHVYRAGVALLDLNDPQKILARTCVPLLEPEEDYEKHGDIPSVVFPEGAVIRDGELFLYYGAADKTCCLATCQMDELMEFLFENKV